MAVADEETMDEQDKGVLNFQETKEFHAEPYLCSVYDHGKRRVVTFEVYGLDTQDMLHKQYTYNEFDSLFRFNAELMNPNRKEGRYHWVIERLEIGQVGSERKLRLAAEVTKEVPETPIYETNRKIPTGRMDLKERQRLRDQMDMLNIRREEKIRSKKEESKKKFLAHILKLQEDNARREKEQAESIEKEREKRYQFQLQMEMEEEEEEKQKGLIQKQRRIAAENKDRAHEEKEEEDLRQLRIRWKTADAEKARHIAEARARKEREVVEKAEKVKQAAVVSKELDAKREVAMAGREKRVLKKKQDLVDRARSLIPELRRLENLKKERNSEHLQHWNDDRWPVFHAQLERMRERAKDREAEAEAVKLYFEQRALPDKQNKKGKHAKSAGKKGDKKGGKKKDDGDHDEHDGDGKKDTEKIVDGVEAKMRQQMAEANRRQVLEQKREEKMQEKEERRKALELRRIAEYKAKYKMEEAKMVAASNERRLILSTKEEESAKATERQKEEDDRLRNVRERRVAAHEQKQLEWLMSH